MGLDIMLMVSFILALVMITWFSFIIVGEQSKMADDEDYKFRKRRLIAPVIVILVWLLNPWYITTSGETKAVLKSYTAPQVDEKDIEIKRNKVYTYQAPDNQEEIERLMKRDFNSQTENETGE